jgi:hypothetical protein
VSLWSRDQLRVALAPGGLALVRHRGNPGKPLASKTLEADTRDWKSLLPLLERELADAAWRTPTIEVVVSNQFARLVLTAPPGKALKQAEESALVGASLREIYGEEAQTWRIRVQSQPPQFGLVGAAVDEALASQLGAVFKRSGCKHWSLRPLASIATGRTVRSDWWLLAEPGWLCIFLQRGGYVRHLSCRPVNDDWRSNLPYLLNRETGSAGLPPASGTQSALIQAVGIGHVTPPAAPGWNWRVATHNSNERGVLALAME